MRSVRIALILLICSMIFVISNSLALSSIIDDVIAKTDHATEDITHAKNEYEKIYDDLDKKMTYISLTVNHEDLTSITEGFAELIGAIEAGDEDAFITVKSRLISSLKHIRRLAGINIDSIL